jgi:hypothetical protein
VELYEEAGKQQLGGIETDIRISADVLDKN